MKRILLLFSIFYTLSFYGQNDTLSIVRHTENDLITPKDVKVLFRGMTNEMFIDVPNAKSFTVSGRDVIKKGKNIYTLNPGAGNETVIKIDIVLKNKKKLLRNMFLR